MSAARIARVLLTAAVAALVCVAPGAAESSAPDAPDVELVSPAQGDVFYQGQRVQAAWGCLPGALGWPVISCSGDLPLGALLDTQTVGEHAFTVRAEDYAGAVTTVTHTYTVVDVIAPTVDLATPAEHQVFTVGEAATVDYTCDDPGGSGVQACIGSLPEGSPLPTSQLGTFTVTVDAFDWANLHTRVTHTYTVVDRTPPAVSIATPSAPVGDHVPVYVLGGVVRADYSCSDDSGSLPVCAGPVASGSPLDTATVGRHRFTVTARDLAGNTTTLSRAYDVVYAFDGFYAPLGGSPLRAGDVVPLKFSLHGAFGLGVVRSVTWIPCSGGNATVAAGSLSYSAGPDRYTFQWQSDRAWAAGCVQVNVFLDDGTIHSAQVRFK